MTKKITPCVRVKKLNNDERERYLKQRGAAK